MDELSFHAAAYVEQQRYAEARHFLAKVLNRAHSTAVEDLEFSGLQVANEVSTAVADDGSQSYDVDARPEYRSRTVSRGLKEHRSGEQEPDHQSIIGYKAI